MRRGGGWGERERKCVGLAEGNYCLAERDALTHQSQIMEDR